jgi:MFS family permease
MAQAIADGGPAPPVPRAGRYRWLIVAVLFAATTVNYIDRTMLGLLAPTLGDELGWSENDYGNIVTAFQAAYALGFLLMGWLIDRRSGMSRMALRRQSSLSCWRASYWVSAKQGIFRRSSAPRASGFRKRNAPMQSAGSTARRRSASS